jgi:hypothetical protein
MHLSLPASGPAQGPVQWVLKLFIQKWSSQGMALTTHPQLVPKFKKEWYVWTLTACYRVKFTFIYNLLFTVTSNLLC